MSSQKAPPAFQLYTKDFDTDENVMLMTCEQEGAYFRLLRVHWREGSIPASLDDVAALIRVQSSRLRSAIWPRVGRCFTPDGAPDGRLINPRMARDLATLGAFREDCARRGKRGAEARWRDGSAMAQPSNGNGSAIKQPMANDGSPFSVLQPPVTEASGSKRATREPSLAVPLSSHRPPAPEQPPNGRPQNPLISGEQHRANQAEALELVGKIAALTGEDPAEVFATASEYTDRNGNKRRAMNPAAMSPERLALTLSDLRGTLAEAKRHADAGGRQSIAEITERRRKLREAGGGAA